MAHNFCKRTNRGFINIRNLKSGRIDLISRTHRTDNRSTCGFGVNDESDFPRYGIDRVNDIIILRKIKLIRRFRRIKGFVSVDYRVGIYLVNPFRGNVDFIFPDGFTGCVYLTIYIRKADFIVVD